MNRRATQQCNKSPYVYAVYWLPPASSAFLLARKCNWLAEKMLITCVSAASKTSKVPTQDALLFISYSMLRELFVYYAVYGSGRGRCRDFLVLKWGGGLNLQIWDLNRAHETEKTVFPILQVFSMCRCKLWHKRKHKGYSTNSAMNTLWTQNTFTINKTCWQ